METKNCPWNSTLADLPNPSWAARSPARVSTIVRISGVLLCAYAVLLENWVLPGKNVTLTVDAATCKELATAGPNRSVWHPSRSVDFPSHMSFAWPTANLCMALFAAVTFLGRSEWSFIQEVAMSKPDAEPRAFETAVVAAS